MTFAAPALSAIRLGSTAAAGVIVGAVLALGIVTGWLRLTVVGIVVVTLLQGIWIILVAAHLLREGSNGRNV
jgi:hypothetical protein